MILKNLVKKLIDFMAGYYDKKIYIQLLKYDKENDDHKYYRFNITDLSEGGHLGSEEYALINGNINSCTEIDSGWIEPTNGDKFGKSIDILTKRKIIIKENGKGQYDRRKNKKDIRTI